MNKYVWITCCTLLFILKTDKTNKFAALLKIGAKHMHKDTIITKRETEGIQGEANGHRSMWIKMLGMGEAWGHGGRIRESLIKESCVVPPMKQLVEGSQEAS